MPEPDQAFSAEQFGDLLGSIRPYKDDYWVATSILGPYDLLQLVHIRELIHPLVTLGQPEPVDLFLLSTGESPERWRTKIGGLPYWDAQRPWPVGEDGGRLPFLAQFDFRDSLDIFPDLPGDILVIFGHPDLRNGISLQWESVRTDLQLVSASDIPASDLPVYHSYRWRTSSYPDGEPLEDDDWSRLKPQNAKEILSPYYSLRLYGVQIGRFPALPPDGIDLKPNDEIICTLSSIQPWPDRPFPFINHPAPISEQDCQRYTIEIHDYPPGSDVLGFLAVIRNESGAFESTLRHA